MFIDNKKWTKTNLSRSSIFRLPKKSGIYIFYKEMKLADFPLYNGVLYVGQSNNIYRRLYEHIARESNPVLLRENFDHLSCSYMLCPEEDLDKYENLFFEECNPPANLISPPRPNLISDEAQQENIH